MNIEIIRRDWHRTVSIKRRAHVQSCAETALRLAAQYGVDPVEAEAAALLHDCTKALDTIKQLKFCEKYDIMIRWYDRQSPQVLHAITGAHFARQRFDVTDAVFQAIKSHTTGRAGMTMLDKIIYIADLIEPTRSFPEVGKFRKLAELSLDRTVLEYAACTISRLISKSSAIHPATLETYNFLLRERNENGK